MTDDKAAARAARAATMAKLTDTKAPAGASRDLPLPLEIQAQQVAAIIRKAGWSMIKFEVTPQNVIDMEFARMVDGHKMIVVGLSDATIANETPDEIAARLLKAAT